MAQKRPPLSVYLDTATRSAVDVIAGELTDGNASKLVTKFVKAGIRRWEKKRYGQQPQQAKAFQAEERTPERRIHRCADAHEHESPGLQYGPISWLPAGSVGALSYLATT
jgi:hypothetical protein